MKSFDAVATAVVTAMEAHARNVGAAGVLDTEIAQKGWEAYERG